VELSEADRDALRQYGLTSASLAADPTDTGM
jgi:hypothetical protein